MEATDGGLLISLAELDFAMIHRFYSQVKLNSESSNCIWKTTDHLTTTRGVANLQFGFAASRSTNYMGKTKHTKSFNIAHIQILFTVFVTLNFVSV